jgi:hypothetical protein
LTQDEKLFKYLPYMEEVLAGAYICHTVPHSSEYERLGDEARYQREQEERERKQAEWDAEWDRRMAEAEAEGHEGKEAKMIVFGRIVSEIGRAVA